MLKTMRITISLVVAALVTSFGYMPANADGNFPTGIAGVVGLRPVEAASCVAVWVPIPEGKALSGFSWYNNDGSVTFPEFLLESGNPNNPVTLSDAVVMAESVRGLSSGWSEVDLSEPVSCLSEGLYLLFRFPEGSEYTADGVGGGAALGYCTDGTGYPGWVSADGREWVAFSGDFGIAISPVFVAVEDATLIMKSGQQESRGQVANEKEPVSLGVYPNPFNPITTLRFYLKQPGRVDLAVYNLRGALVKRLASEVFMAGPHEVVWRGRDERSRGVASGVYFARFRTGGVVLIQRLVLVQ